MADTHFSNPHHQQLADYLQISIGTGRLGTGERESTSSSKWVLVRFALFALRNAPYVSILLQFCWSITITGIAYYVSSNNPTTANESTLSTSFWRGRVAVSPTVTFGAGWALFALLAFYVREANGRYVSAHTALHRLGAISLRFVRTLRATSCRGAWHDGDFNRIVSHLIAYPIALKMDLRNEVDRDILKRVLHDDDVKDVLNSDVMHVQCTRVVRAYLTVADKGNSEFQACTNSEFAIMGERPLVKMIHHIDAIDDFAATLVRISKFRPSIPYINHLKIFLYIWMFFLPMSIIRTAGWYVKSSIRKCPWHRLQKLIIL